VGSVIGPCYTPEVKNAEYEKCAPEHFFRKLLEFCYTGNYEECNSTDPRKPLWNCLGHIYMYALGQRYGVDDILHHAIKGFAENVQILLSTDPDSHNAALFIELVYKIPNLDDTDALRNEATKQAELLVGGMLIKIPNEIIDKETRKQVEEILPNAGPSVLARGIKPKTFDMDVPSCLAEERFCIRCYDVLSGEEDAFERRCSKCDNAPFTEQRVDAPHQAYLGVSMIFWQCSGCNKRWNAEGARTRALEMEECLACVLGSGLGRGQRLKGDPVGMSWDCSGCRTIWYARGTDKGTRAELTECICCGEQGE
jgi:hypothetical protein